MATELRMRSLERGVPSDNAPRLVAGRKRARASKRILLVEDRGEVAELLQRCLAAGGFEVMLLGDGLEVLPSATVSSPDLILLELDLPGIGGLEACRLLRADARTSRVPVILIGSEVSERDKVRGFEAGANDFLSRPFGLDEFVARVKALLRHEGGSPRRGVLRAGRIELNLDLHRVRVRGRRVVLTTMELALLRELMSLAGLTLRRSYLLDRIRTRGSGECHGSRTIDSHVARIRRRLGPEGRRIVTVRGVGYRFEQASSRSDRRWLPARRARRGEPGIQRPAAIAHKGTRMD
jgi:DNA-binding response OmpR family regulator